MAIVASEMFESAETQHPDMWKKTEGKKAIPDPKNVLQGLQREDVRTIVWFMHPAEIEKDKVNAGVYHFKLKWVGAKDLQMFSDEKGREIVSA